MRTRRIDATQAMLEVRQGWFFSCCPSPFLICILQHESKCGLTPDFTNNLFYLNSVGISQALLVRIMLGGAKNWTPTWQDMFR